MGLLNAIAVIVVLYIALNVLNNITQKDCASVVLSPDKVYLFQSNVVGYFRIRGGITGNITVDGNKVTIWELIDDQRAFLYFQCGSSNDRVELKDVEGITTVNLIPNGARTLSIPSEDNIIKYKFKHNEIQVNQDFSSDDYENPGPLQIVGCPDYLTIIAGHRPAIVTATGNGGYLKKMGGNKVTVRGSLQRVSQEGTSTVYVHGNVTGDVSDAGSGNIYIKGDVYGTVTADGMGSIIVKGNVHGDIRCKGYGSVKVQGSHLNGGKVIIVEYGQVSVDGAGMTGYVNKLLRLISLN